MTKTYAEVLQESRFRDNSVGHLFWKQKKSARIISRGIYTTSEYPQTKIRNAISGNTMPGVVGNRADEKQYYKVKYAVGKPELQSAIHSNTLFFQNYAEFCDYLGFQQPDAIFV